jgi:hypothetical protein
VPAPAGDGSAIGDFPASRSADAPVDEDFAGGVAAVRDGVTGETRAVWHDD